jgi:hypothetical protein
VVDIIHTFLNIVAFAGYFCAEYRRQFWR